MADVQYVTVTLSDGTPVQVVAGTPLHELYLALAGFTTPATGGAPDIDLTTLRPMAWFMTPHGPQSVIEPATIAEFERRDYTPLTAQQAADFFAGVAAPVPYSLVTEAELAEALGQRDTQAIPDSRLPARLADDALKAALGTAFKVPAPTGVAATDTANIQATRAQAAAAVTSGSPPPVVAYRAGTYRLNATLPPLPGVLDLGVQPTFGYTSYTPGIWMADGEWTYTGGTVLQGDGTFPCFAANTTPAGSPAADFGTQQIAAWGCRNFGFDNFSYAIQVGATNVMGLAYCELDNLWAKNCTEWAFWLANFAHCTIGALYSCSSRNGQYYGSLLAGDVFAPTNSHFTKELFHKRPGQGSAYNPRFSRSIVFDVVGANAGFGQAVVNRLQVNAYNTSLFTALATLTSGSNAIAVPDGAQFAVGMIVTFTATGGGFTANTAYYVQAVTGNNLTLSTSRAGAAIAATASTTLTVQTYGFPLAEVTSGNTGARVNACDFRWIDLEGTASVGLYVEGANSNNFAITAIPTTALVDVVQRRATLNSYHCTQSAKTDFDSASAQTYWTGLRSSTYGVPGMGQWRDGVSGQNVWALGNGGAGSTGDLSTRANGLLYPHGLGIGRKLSAINGTVSLNMTQCGNVIYAAAGGHTFTLPTINNDNIPADSQVGGWYEIANVGTGNLTIATNGTQTMNKVSGRTSTTLTPGNSIFLYACRDASGNFFWLARVMTLLP